MHGISNPNLKIRMDGRMEGRMDKPKAICPFNFSKVEDLIKTFKYMMNDAHQHEY